MNSAYFVMSFTIITWMSKIHDFLLKITVYEKWSKHIDPKILVKIMPEGLSLRYLYEYYHLQEGQISFHPHVSHSD